jgi:hypothetical protein
LVVVVVVDTTVVGESTLQAQAALVEMDLFRLIQL